MYERCLELYRTISAQHAQWQKKRTRKRRQALDEEVRRIAGDLRARGPESNSDPDRMAAKRGLAQGMARASAIGEESTAISRTVIEPLLPHQDPSLVVRRKLTDPEFSRFTCFVPCSLSRRRMPLDGPSMEGTKRHAGAPSTFITPPETASAYLAGIGWHGARGAP